VAGLCPGQKIRLKAGTEPGHYIKRMIIMQNLKNKVVMITGASSGFGALAAKALVKEGAKVVLAARREDKLKELSDEIGGSQNAVYGKTDVTNREELKALFDKGIDAFGRIDSLINNAGVAYPANIKKGHVEDWDKMIDINIKGVLNSIHTVINHMLERGSGQIINICSMAGHGVLPGMTVYSATKFAVRAISEGLRKETLGKIQVTNISPGTFDTDIIKGILKDQECNELQQRAMRIAAPPERVVDTILFALKQDPDVVINELVIGPVKS